MNHVPPVAALDTNVILDVWSVHDMRVAYDRAAARASEPMTDPSFTFRVTRVRESLVLAMYLNRIRATTYGLEGENTSLITRKVDPNLPSPERGFAAAFSHFVKDWLLPKWDPRLVPSNASRDEADDQLVEIALQYNIPVITNEGARTPNRSRVRTTAASKGVRVLTPREFWSGRIDEETEINQFLALFHALAPLFIQASEQLHLTDEALHVMFGYYDYVLRGRLPGGSSPKQLRLV